MSLFTATFGFLALAAIALLSVDGVARWIGSRQQERETKQRFVALTLMLEYPGKEGARVMKRRSTSRRYTSGDEYSQPGAWLASSRGRRRAAKSACFMGGYCIGADAGPVKVTWWRWVGSARRAWPSIKPKRVFALVNR